MLSPRSVSKATGIFSLVHREQSRREIGQKRLRAQPHADRIKEMHRHKYFINDDARPEEPNIVVSECDKTAAVLQSRATEAHQDQRFWIAWEHSFPVATHADFISRARMAVFSWLSSLFSRHTFIELPLYQHHRIISTVQICFAVFCIAQCVHCFIQSSTEYAVQSDGVVSHVKVFLSSHHRTIIHVYLKNQTTAPSTKAIVA